MSHEDSGRTRAFLKYPQCRFALKGEMNNSTETMAVLAIIHDIYL